jgi:diguanylate cyclase (GGDEF)-like protein
MNPLLSRLALKILAILVCCGVLPSLAAGVYLLEQNEKTHNERAKDSLAMTLVSRRAEIDAWLGERLDDATRWSASFVVLEDVEALLRPETNAKRVRGDLTKYLESVLGNYRDYESLFIIDRKGDVLASTRRERLEAWEHDFLDREPKAERGLVTPIHQSEMLGRPTLLVLYPIQGRSGGQLGYLVERIDLREFEKLFQSPEEDRSVSFWLLDADGRYQVKEGRLVGPDEESPPNWLLKATSSAELGEGDIPGVGPGLYAYASLSLPYRGTLVASVAKAKVGSLADASARLLKFALPAAIILLVAFVWAVRGLLRPILLLSEGARRLSAGDLNIYLPVRGRDETAALTAAFNEMTRRLRDGRLEIEEARDELARANQDLRTANRTLETLAITDGLTGLYNHRHFQDTLDREIRRCDREGRPLSLLMIDIDHFKQFNDRWGHTEGDAALRRVAAQIMKTTRATDTAFRYGGEEIAVLLPGCLKEQACEVAEKIRGVVAANPMRRGRTGSTLTVSVGVATSPDDGRVGRGLVDAADTALYAAKARGRDRVVLAGRDAAAGPRAET